MGHCELNAAKKGSPLRVAVKKSVLNDYKALHRPTSNHQWLYSSIKQGEGLLCVIEKVKSVLAFETISQVFWA